MHLEGRNQVMQLWVSLLVWNITGNDVLDEEKYALRRIYPNDRNPPQSTTVHGNGEHLEPDTPFFNSLTLCPDTHLSIQLQEKMPEIWNQTV